MSRANTTQTTKRAPATMAFSAYISGVGGDAAAARILGISERRVRSWRYRERHPRWRDIPDLIHRSGGALGPDSFLGPDFYLPTPGTGKSRKVEETKKCS